MVRRQSLWLTIGFFILLFGGSEILIRAGTFPTALVPTPSTVVLVTISNATTILSHLGYTFSRIILSYLFGVVLGIGLGLITAHNFYLDRTLGKIIHGLFPIPTITFIGLFIFWFGVGERTIIILATVGVFFVIYINVYSGVKVLEPHYLEVFRNLGGRSSWALFQSVIMPAIVPYLLSGLRYSLGRVLGAVVVSEYIVSNNGLGYLVSRAVNEFRPELVVSYQLVIAIIGLLMYRVFDLWRHRAFSWLRQRENESHAPFTV